jgi:hypothetical protein
VCNIVPGAVINVTGNINVAPGAVLDAQSVTSTITVGHNISAGQGSLLGLGCQPTNTISRFAGVPCVAWIKRCLALLDLVRGAQRGGPLMAWPGRFPWCLTATRERLIRELA